MLGVVRWMPECAGFRVVLVGYILMVMGSLIRVWTHSCEVIQFVFNREVQRVSGVGGHIAGREAGREALAAFQVNGEGLSLERAFRELIPSYIHSVLHEALLRARHHSQCRGYEVNKTGEAPAIGSAHSRIK